MSVTKIMLAVTCRKCADAEFEYQMHTATDCSQVIPVASRRSRRRWLVMWGKLASSTNLEYETCMCLAIDGLTEGTYRTISAAAKAQKVVHGHVVGDSRSSKQARKQHPPPKPCLKARPGFRGLSSGFAKPQAGP
ncbi:hypothetical protein EDD16DRAFT_1526588 [Pisolithus croceorrhizus]|nr:hypothetical protein EDD16DRAFT_1526588 [Pisolithus croceorrhizus]KAI6119480.1 hypothetical protein EV401DRAFT_1888217 [Pisolithus croceorrhizus]KAI6165609.1 hypothetical protein EDD17DRAFT_1505654 [Pisolithus thermaeus]